MIDAPRIPPHSVEAEMGLLGAALHPGNAGADPMLYVCAEQGITADSFYVMANRIVMGAILEMHQTQRHVDLVTLTVHLRQVGTLDHVGGAVHLDTLLESCIAKDYATHYAQIVRHNEKLRGVIDTGRDMIRSAYDADADQGADAIASDGVEQLMRLSASQDKLTHAVIERDVSERWDAAHSGNPSGLPMPWKDLESRCGGPPTGLLSLIVADKGTGKSTMFGQWAHYLASQGIPVGVAPFEDGPRRFFGRMGCFDASQSYFAAEHGRLHPNELQAAQDGLKRATGLPIQFTPSRCTLGEFEAWAVRCKSKYGIQAIFADAFKDFITPGKGNEDDIVLTAGLVALAERLDIPIICSAHIRKPMQDGKPRRIKLKDVRGSSQIGDAAKWVMAIQNVNEEFSFDLIESNHGPTDWVCVDRLTGPERFEETTQEGLPT